MFIQEVFCFKNNLVGEQKRTLVIQDVTQCDPSELIEVIVVQEHVTPGQGSISSGSTNLLDIVLNRSRHVVVDNRLDIALVNSHTERDGAAENSDSILDELFLGVGSLLVCLSRMIGH